MWTRSSCGGMALAIALAAGACGGDGGGGSPTSPSPSGGGGTSASVTVNITTTAGSQSFNPNPASMATAGTVAWTNSDGAVHRIVANDGSFDTGDISPGATSRAVTVSGGRRELSLLDSPGDDRSDWRGAGTATAAVHGAVLRLKVARAATSFSSPRR